MDYQERDRLGLSIIISAILYALLFGAFWFVPWDEFEPFPEPDPIVLVELEEFAVREAQESPVPAETAMEVEQPVPAEETPAPAPPPVPPAPAPQAAAPGPAPAPAPRPAPSPPAARTQQPAPTPAPQPSRPAASAEQSVPPPPPGPSFRADQPRFDPALAAELEFLGNEQAKLEKYLRDNAPQYLPDAPPPPAGTTAARPAKDPVAEQIREDLINVTRKIQALRQSAGETSPASPPPQSTIRPPASRPPSVTQPIRDTAGREIGTGQLEGRSPMGGLGLVLSRDDFDGNVPPSIRITAEFEIFETGAVDPNPATLKISGDTRYTKVNEKIRAALRSWRFSPRQGVRTKASIAFEIKSSDVVR